MKKIKIKEKRVFGILGLPRTGTTLINNTLNSYDNSFSISEPHWVNILRPGQLKTDKIDLDMSNNNNNFNEVKKFLEKSKYDLGGIKETYRTKQKESANFILKSNIVDFIIVVLRNPLYGFSGWVRSEGSSANKDLFINDYKSLIKDCENFNGDVFWLSYEKFCEEGIDYLNNIFNDYLEIPKIDSIRKPNYVFGDDIANEGGEIKKPNKEIKGVNNETKDLLEKELMPLYEKYIKSNYEVY